MSSTEASVLARDAGTIPALAARGITKRFGSLVANDGVDFDVCTGEVHALLGENGAGKSTLVKVLYGFHQPDAGEITVGGDQVHFRSPADARARGVGLVFQQSTLIPAFTVAENIALQLPDLPRVLRMGEIAERIRETSERYGLPVDPDVRAGRLSVGEQQRVEVLRLLLAGSKILFFDEPTSVLTSDEIDALFAVFARLRADGYPIVFITHKLKEVFACADRVTVMRRGAVAGSLDIGSATEEDLVAMMFGSLAPPSRRSPTRVPGDATTLVSLRGIRSRPRGGVTLRDLDLDVRAGEIVGVAGVSGNGQRELGDVVLGMLPLANGTKRLFGNDASHWGVRRVRESGVAFIPENPMGMAFAPGMSVAENIALGDTRRFARASGFAVDWTAVDAQLAHSGELGLELPDPRRRVATLSGGNAQRFLIGRELSRNPRVIVALYPTKGLDVPTVSHVQSMLVAARDAGAGVLLISHDLSELIALSDRIVVLRDGRIVGEVAPVDADARTIGRMMTGGEVHAP